MNPWTWIVDKVTPPPKWARGPWKTSLTHAVISVLGLQVPLPLVGRLPIGPLGIFVYWRWTSPWLWLASSTLTAAWYAVREKKQQSWSWARFREQGFAMFLKPKFHNGLRHSFSERWDPVFDAVLPWVAVGAQWWWLT